MVTKNRRQLFKSFFLLKKDQNSSFSLSLISLLTLFSSSFLLFIVSSLNNYQVIFSQICAEEGIMIDHTSLWDNSDYAIIGLSFIFLIFSAFIAFMSRTEKIYGPLVPIKKAISQLKAGDYSVQVNLRKNDDFQDIAKKINILAKNLEILEKNRHKKQPDT